MSEAEIINTEEQAMDKNDAQQTDEVTNVPEEKKEESSTTKALTETTAASTETAPVTDSLESRKIFVGGITSALKSEDIQEHFSQFGEVTDVNLKETHQPRGYGFITFSAASGARDALSKGPHVLKGITLDTKPAHAKKTLKKIIVRGIDPKLPSEQIQAHFETFGKIAEFKHPFDKDKNENRPFCFVTFETDQATEASCLEAKHSIDQFEVRVEKAKHDRRPGQAPYQRGGFHRGAPNYAPAPFGQYAPQVGPWASPRGGHFNFHPYGR